MSLQPMEWLVEEIKGNQAIALSLLEAEHPLFASVHLQEDDGKIILSPQLLSGAYQWDDLYQLSLDQQLRHLLNVCQIFPVLHESVYTYHLSPDQVYFDRNGLPRLCHRGLVGQVPPYAQPTESEFLEQFKLMAVSLLDHNTEYETLSDGKLPFYKGDLFCEELLSYDNLSELRASLEDKYLKEKARYDENFSLVSNKQSGRLKAVALASGLLGLVACLGLAYYQFYAMPRQELVSSIRLAFANQDYSGVVTQLKGIGGKELSQDDKYIAAYSVVKTEPLSEEQIQTLSNHLTKQSSESYLRYWIAVGQSNLDEAMDIASFLDDPQLLMYAMTKKVDDIKRNPNLTAEERTAELTTYKEKLDELKEKYLTPESSSSNEGTEPNSQTETSASEAETPSSSTKDKEE